MIKYIIQGDPRTKKNHPQIIRNGKFPVLLPSRQFLDYQRDALKQLNCQDIKETIDYPINLRVLYYMKTRRRVDGVNLLEATCDILQATNPPIISDDNSKIIAGYDGTRVFYDKDHPRAEIYITRLDEETI